FHPTEWVCIAGIDLAHRRDHAALVVVAWQWGTGRVRIANVWEWAPVAGYDIDLRDVMEAVREANRLYGVTMVYGDECQAILMSQILAQEGIQFIGVPQAGKAASGRAMQLVDAFKNR